MQRLCSAALAQYLSSYQCIGQQLDVTVQHKPPFLRLAFAFSLLLVQSNLHAQTWQSLDKIRAAADSFMQQSAESSKLDMEYTIGKLDPRLHLPACGKALKVKARYKIRPGSSSLLIHCDSKKPWKVYLPVEIKIWRSVLAASHPLPRGHIVSEQDIITVRELQKNAFQARYVQEQQTELLGKILKRAMPSGSPYDARTLKAPLWVKRGETVILFAKTKTMQIRMKGAALADGAKGDLIKVRNLSSRRIVEGIVVKPGIISVRM